MRKKRRDITEKRFYAMSDRGRLTLLEIIGKHDGLLNVAELGKELSERVGRRYAQPTVTHHLILLEEAGLISKTEKSLYVYCHLCPGALAEMAQLIGTMRAISYQEVTA